MPDPSAAWRCPRCKKTCPVDPVVCSSCGYDSREASAAQTQGFMLSPGHIDGCFVVETFDSFPPLDFVVYDGTEQRDKIGRRCREGSGRQWHRFTCQDPKCPAVALVRWDTLAEFVSAPLRPTA